MCGGSDLRKGLASASCVYSSGAGKSSASMSDRMLVLPLMMMDSVSRPRQVPWTCWAGGAFEGHPTHGRAADDRCCECPSM
jgi:hypothetical protein